MSRLAVFFVIALLSACTTVPAQSLRLPMSQTNHCADPVGVTVKQRALTIALGERPTAGYGIDVVAQEGQGDSLALTYRERRPQPGMMHAQVMTSPCLQIMLPSGWQQVTVTNADNGRQWQLTPSDSIEKRMGQ